LLKLLRGDCGRGSGWRDGNGSILARRSKNSIDIYGLEVTGGSLCPG
jgi:hypothetical protein